MINIVENTLRDGSYVVDFQFNEKQTRRVVEGLNNIGFQYIEVGHGLGLGAGNFDKYGRSRENDATYIRSAKESASMSSIVAFFVPGIGNEDDIVAAKGNGLDFIRIGTNINSFNKALHYARTAKKLGLKVAINLMKSYAVKSYEFSHILEQIDEWQLADVIYLVDSAGCMVPEEVHEYIDRSMQRITTDIGFHGHNNLSLGVANTIQAAKSGARYLDTCVRGMGRSAGNAQTEIVVHLLKKLGIDLGIDIYQLYDFSDNVIYPLMTRKQGLSSAEVHIGVSKFHSSYMSYAEKVSEQYGVDRKKLIKAVSDVDCLNPTLELFDLVAKSM